MSQKMAETFDRMSEPFFTVIIPTCNRAELLREAMQSVLDQTHENFEMIVVDDHSTDNTKDIVGSFNDNRIMYALNDRSKGAAGARNTGIFRAKGRWITFLDSDDTWLPEKLEKQAKKIQKVDATVGFIYAGYALYDFAGKKEIAIYLPEKEGFIQKELLYNNYITALCSVAVRRDILLQVGGFDENFPALEDWELYVRIAGITKFGVVKEKLVYVRTANDDRLSFNVRRKLRGALMFRNKYDTFTGKSPRHCNRLARIILIWSLEISDWSTALKAFQWVLADIFIDPYGFCKTIKSVLLIFLDKSRKL
jgi:glycosyltransferase involved in cell wall biosynthesis